MDEHAHGGDHKAASQDEAMETSQTAMQAKVQQQENPFCQILFVCPHPIKSAKPLLTIYGE